MALHFAIEVKLVSTVFCNQAIPNHQEEEVANPMVVVVLAVLVLPGVVVRRLPHLHFL